METQAQEQTELQPATVENLQHVEHLLTLVRIKLDESMTVLECARAFLVQRACCPGRCACPTCEDTAAIIVEAIDELRPGGR